MSDEEPGGDSPAVAPLPRRVRGRPKKLARGTEPAKGVDQIRDGGDEFRVGDAVHAPHIATNRSGNASYKQILENQRPAGLKPGMTDGGDSIEDIGARVALLREWAGYSSQIGFSRALGLADAEIGHYERGRRRLTLSTAQKIRARYRVTLDWLYHGDRTGLSLEVERALPRLTK